ncbi:MAG: rhodanese-related sulfurtransferase [Actinomycetia bacterium]|nr:rhodanese-related sulfurtransferase [Actinomycetes bacterium]
MFHIAAFYLFVQLENPRAVADALRTFCRERNIRGTVLIAPEGINGTIAGSQKGVDAVVEYLRADARFMNLEAKMATAESDPFYRLKVRLKKEIVTLGVGVVDTAGRTASRVPVGEWNALISDPDTVVIDTRNDYEVAIGTFAGAINPATGSFRDLPAWIDEHSELKGKRLAMFCTGGIRCEKATAYLLENGYNEVYQLEGGILKYLEAADEGSSLWNGECYVFDRRVSVGHGLVAGDLEVCPGCNHVIGDKQRQNGRYRRGICCHGCADDLTPERESRFEERQRQIELAELRGETHLGSVFEESR